MVIMVALLGFSISIDVLLEANLFPFAHFFKL